MKNSINFLVPFIFLVALIFFNSPKSTVLAGDYYNSFINLASYNSGLLDESNDSSETLLSAWNSACDSVSPSTIYVPEGRYLVNSPVIFSGKKCKNNDIRFVIEGTFVGPTDFNVFKNAKTWFSFEDVAGVSISGAGAGGVFDGQGAGLWACKKSGGHCPRGVTTLRFTNSRNIVINGITSLDSQLYHIVIDGCKNVRVQGVTVSAPRGSPNTDGIHVQQSMGVTILDSKIGTGDDCVSIGPGTQNLWIETMSCGPGHGISIGSLGKKLNEAGVQNVTVKTATFTDTENGVRIKSWGRPSNGYVTNVLFQDLNMVNAKHPIIIDQNYCPNDKGCPAKVSGIKISDVTYQDVHGSSATRVAVKFDCSSKNHCTDINLYDVDLSYKNQESFSSCVNVFGSTYGSIEPKSCF